MDTLQKIQITLAQAFPNQTSVDIEATSLTIYQNLVEAQGKQEVEPFTRSTPEQVAVAITLRLQNGWSVFQTQFVGESTIEDPAAPGVLPAFAGMSGIIIYSKP